MYILNNRFMLLLCLAITPAAKGYSRQMIKWAEVPAVHTISDSMKKQGAVFILEEKQLELVEVGKDYRFYRTVHHLIHLNDEKGVGNYNTFSVPIGRDHAVDGIKARTILPDGRTFEVSRDKIKEVKNESGQPEFLVAMEHVEPGAEVELIFTQELYASSYGTEVYQFNAPILNSIFRLIVPKRLRYDLKGYNGFPDPKDSIVGGMHYYTAAYSNIPDLDAEPYSRYRPSLMRIDYKFSYVDGDDGNVRRLTWSDYVKQMYKSLGVFTEGEQREAAKMIASIGIKPDERELTKAIAIEDYFKSNITMADNLTEEEATNFKRIASRKLTSERGYMRFFVACLAAAGISYEVGLLDGRFSYPMDEELEVWDRLDLYAVYLPRQKAYLAPTAILFRYPFLPYIMCGARGLFTKTTTLGTMVSALPDIRTIPHTAMMQNVSSVNAVVNFDGASLTPRVALTHSFSGYSASGLREAFLFAAEDKQKEIVQTMCNIAEKPTDIESYKVENKPFSDYTTNKPLELDAVVRSPNLLEKAGSKYLFKVGEVIGRQSELYQENKRSLPVELNYPHDLPRTIRINIPEGYKVINPEAVRLNVLYDVNDKDVCGFVSDYKMEGNELVVSIHEYYRNVSYPLAGYEAFRRVINAAADFNKVVLVMQKI